MTLLVTGRHRGRMSWPMGRDARLTLGHAWTYRSFSIFFSSGIRLTMMPSPGTSDIVTCVQQRAPGIHSRAPHEIVEPMTCISVCRLHRIYIRGDLPKVLQADVTKGTRRTLCRYLSCQLFRKFKKTPQSGNIWEKSGVSSSCSLPHARIRCRAR